MSNTQHLFRTLAPIATLALMTACGGSSSGGSTPPDDSNAPNDEQRFTDVTASTGIDFVHGLVAPTQESEPATPENSAMIMVELFAGGVAAGDIDNDADIDLFIVRGDIGANRLYRNDGNNTFTDIAANSSGLASTKSATENHLHSGPAFADMDGDGFLDLFIGGLGGDPSFIFRNNGDGSFSDVTASSPGIANMESVHTISAAFGDYDLDGDVDMFLSHWGTPRTVGSPGDTEHLWRNDSVGDEIVFTSVSESAGISPSIIVSSEVDVTKGVLGDNHDYTFTPTFARIDDDPYPDLLVVADFRTTQVFFNNGDGSFRNVTGDSTEASGIPVIKDHNGMGSAVADYDMDGDLDWFVTGIYGENHQVGNRLYRNDGDRFADASTEAKVYNGAWGWAACFADFDNDLDLDLYHTNGWRNNNTGNWATDPSRLFVSPGGPESLGDFEEKSGAWGIRDTEQGRGVVCSDFDNDGDVDVFVVHRNSNLSASLYRNDSNDHNWLAVKLSGVGPNTEALGARIRVTTGEHTQLREVMAGNNFTSQNPTVQLVGLGSFSQADRVEVEWPDGSTTQLQGVAANQRIEVNQ